MVAINLKAILEAMTAERDNKYKSGLDVMSDIAGLFGSDYMKGAEKSALSTMEQSMAGRGLGGSTRPGAISVGMKAGFEDTRRDRRASSLLNIGKYIQGGTPTAGNISHLATGGFSGLLSADQLAYQKSLINPDWLALQK